MVNLIEIEVCAGVHNLAKMAGAGVQTSTFRMYSTSIARQWFLFHRR